MAKKLAKVKYIRGGKVPSANKASGGTLIETAIMGASAVPTVDPLGARPFSGRTAIVKPTPFAGTNSLGQQLDVMEMQSEDANLYDPEVGYGKTPMKNGKFTETGAETVRKMKRAKVKKAK